MSLQNIPAELRQRPQWVISGADKVPRTPRTGQLADPTDPATWGTFEEATNAGMKFIGYVLHKDDPYTAIDLDPPLTSQQADRHAHILEAAESFAEVSQSGNGVHIFVRGKIPHGVRRDKVEVYSDGRYMICTGNVLNALPIADRQDLLDVLYKEMSTTSAVALVEQDETMPDDALWQMGHDADNGEKFDRLWTGDFADYPSQSEADFALMSMLCFYSKSNEQCRRVFRMSELGKRDKAMRNRYLDYMIEKCRAHEPPKVDLEKIRGMPTHLLGTPAQVLNGTAQLITADQLPPQPPNENNDPDPIRDDAAQPVLHYPPGLVGQIAEYVYGRSIRPVKEISLATALALTAGISGRSYNVSGTGLNQYIILLAKTGSGKEGAASAIDALVAALRPSLPMADRFIGPAAFASGQALIRVLDERPCFVSILGEFGTTLQMLCDPRANDGTRMLKRVVLDLYNKSGFSNVIRPSVYSDSDKNTKMVRAPSITILGESTPEELYGHLDPSHVTSGLLPRCSIIEYTGPRPIRNPNAFQPPPDDLLNPLGELITIALTTQQNNTCCPVQIDSHAQAVFVEFDDYADNQINSRGEIDRHLWNRAHLKALKLAALIAVGCNPQEPTIDKAMAEWARDFVFNDVQLISGKFATGDIGMGESKQEIDLRIAVRDYRGMTQDTRRKSYKVPDKLLKESNVIPYHYLRRRLQQCTSFKNDRRGLTVALDTMLETMVAAEALIKIDRRTAAESFEVSQALYAAGPTF